MKQNKNLKVLVEVSREWEGEKVAEDLINKIKPKITKPKFILLFVTIHYKKEFKQILSKLKESFSKSPIVGGTVAGFIAPQGCYTRGVTAFALDYPNMDVAIGVGHNTKRNPKKAARECAEMIRKGLAESKYKNKVLITCISGALIPKLPLIGRINYIKSCILGDLVSYLGMRICAFLGTGVGKEEDIVDELSTILPDFYFFGGTTVDEFRYMSNYQFLDEEIYTNSIVALAFSSNLPIFIDGKIGGRKSNRSCKITGTTYEDRIITKIEHVSAGRYYFEKFLRIRKEQFGKLEPFYYKTSNYFPLGFEECPGYISGTGAILGENILLGYKAKGRQLYLLSVTGEDIVHSVYLLLENCKKEKLSFAFFSSSGIRMNILGNKSFIIKEIIDKSLRDVPYLVVYFTNENIKKPGEKALNRVYSCNVMCI